MLLASALMNMMGRRRGVADRAGGAETRGRFSVAGISVGNLVVVVGLATVNCRVTLGVLMGKCPVEGSGRPEGNCPVALVGISWGVEGRGSVFTRVSVAGSWPVVIAGS